MFKEDKKTKKKLCTGEPAELSRSMKRMRKIKEPVITSNQLGTDEFEPNPNYGRFFVASYEPVLMANGKPKQNDKGYPVTDLVYFKWFDETPYVKCGALQWATEEMPEVSKLLTTFGEERVTDGEEWDEEVLDDLFLQGMDDGEIVSKWSGHEIKKRIRKRKKSQDDDEADTDGESPKKKRNGAAHFIDDEAEEAD